jgi:glutamate synthase domain-containing protein 2
MASIYSFERGLRRHYNADIVTRTRLSFGQHASPSGICSICIMCGNCEIGKQAKTAQPHFPEPFGNQFGAEKVLPNIEDIQIMPELYGGNILFDKVKTECKIGGFKVKMPLSSAAMGSTKVAHDKGAELAKGCARAGIPMAIGENVVITHGKKGLKERMQPYLDSYKKYGALVVQANVHDMKMGVYELAKSYGAHALEIKLGQGAKQGLGGEITFSGKKAAEKYRKYDYHIVDNKDGTFQRHAMPGSLSDQEFKDTVIKYSKLDLPMWVKISIGKGLTKFLHTVDDLNNEIGNVVKCVTIDGFGGGTGMSPWLVMNEHSLPSGAIFSTLGFKPNFDIMLAGGYASGADIAKGLMLGAKGISIGRPLLIAVGTKNEKQKSLGAKGIVNYVSAIRKELQMACATQKVNDICGLVGKKDTLFALSEEAATMFGVNSLTKKVL